MSSHRHAPQKPASAPASAPTPVPSRLVHRKCACGGTPGPTGECEPCRRKRLGLRRKAAETNRSLGGAIPSVAEEVLRSPGSLLDARTRARMEPRFGVSFAHVRVHTDGRGAEAARAVDARAFTAGHHVVLGSGETLHSDGGRLLAHELAHVVQQGRTPGLRRSGIVKASDPSEREADEMAERAMRAPRPRPHPSDRDGTGAPTGVFAASRNGPVVGGRGETESMRAGRPNAGDPPGPLIQRRQRRPTAASAPRLDIEPSVNGTPCACLVFIHNNERNARLTAQLMHRHCSYNLAIIAPDDRRRRIRLPGHRGTVDPNELFPRDVAEECFEDPQPCLDYLTANASSTDRAVVEGYVQRQFFLAIRECSEAFTLPVVALHNNVVSDTARYRARVGAADTSDVRSGTFEETPPSPTSGAQPSAENPARPLEELRDWLTQNFDEETVTALTGRRGTTNIFRWCVSPDISRCHVGDPEHPDTVVWVTSEADFDRLSSESVNVVLQGGASATGESATDLSTLFLVVRELVEGRFAPEVTRLREGVEVDVDRIRAMLRELDQMREYGDLTLGDTFSRLVDILEAIGRLLLRLLELGAMSGASAVRLSQVRYINIETPGSATTAGQTPGQLREESYDAIVATLQAVGLHCCGDDPVAGEGRVREGLRRGTLEEPEPAGR